MRAVIFTSSFLKFDLLESLSFTHLIELAVKIIQLRI